MELVIEQNFLQTVSEKLPGLSPKLQRAATYLLDNPEEVAMNSLRSVASDIGVTAPTLSRLAKALDCESYEVLRDRCRDQIRERGLSLASKVEALQEERRQSKTGEDLPFALQQGTAAVANLERTLADLDVTSLRQAVDRLIAARKVFLIAAMSSAPLADYFAYLTEMPFDNWYCLSGRESSDAARIADLQADTAAIAISLTPCSRRTVELARMARERGAYLLAITDKPSSPLTRYASHCLFCASESPQFFPSHVSSILIIEALTGMLIRRAGQGATARVKGIEETRREIGEFWIEGA